MDDVDLDLRLHPFSADALLLEPAGSRHAPARRPALDARPVEPTPAQPSPAAPPLDPEAPVPDDPGPLQEPDLLPPPPLEPSPDVVPAGEPV